MSGNKTDDKPRRRPASPRIAPVTMDAADDEQKKLLDGFQRTGRLWNVFTTFANHPALMREWLDFATQILYRSTLSPRDRETLILRIGWLCHAEYEWAQHVRIGKDAGLTDSDIARIAHGPTAEGLDGNDRLLLQAVDELHSDACLSDETWKGLSARYDTRQMMDLVFTVGQYNLVSMALNSFGVQLDPDLTGFAKP